MIKIWFNKIILILSCLILVNCNSTANSNDGGNDNVDPQTNINITYTQHTRDFTGGAGVESDPYTLPINDVGAIHLLITNNSKDTLNNFTINASKLPSPFIVSRNPCTKNNIAPNGSCEMIIKVGSNKKITATITKNDLSWTADKQLNDKQFLINNIVVKTIDRLETFLINAGNGYILECHNLPYISDDCKLIDIKAEQTYISAIYNNMFYSFGDSNTNIHDFTACQLDEDNIPSLCVQHDYSIFNFESLNAAKPIKINTITANNNHLYLNVTGSTMSTNIKTTMGFQTCIFDNQYNCRRSHKPFIFTSGVFVDTANIHNDSMYWTTNQSFISKNIINTNNTFEPRITIPTSEVTNKFAFYSTSNGDRVIIAEGNNLKSCVVNNESFDQCLSIKYVAPLQPIQQIAVANNNLYLMFDDSTIRVLSLSSAVIQIKDFATLDFSKYRKHITLPIKIHSFSYIK